MGMAERGGRRATEIVPDIKKATLREVTLQNVEPGSTFSTDELRLTHGRRLPVRRRQSWYKGVRLLRLPAWRGAAHQHGGRLLEAVQGVDSLDPHHVSSKHMQRYLDEFTFRLNHR